MHGKYFSTNKAPYVRKYDYLRSFYQPVDEWFKDAKQIDEYLHEKITKAVGKDTDFDDIDEQESLSDEVEFDSYELLRLNNEFELENDNDDPKIFEGRLIDQKAKEFIIKQFPSHIIYDFDTYFLDPQNSFIKVKSIIEQTNDDFVMFQPTFYIHKDVNQQTIHIVAKPDVLVRTNNKFHLIEVKGTTSTKLIHWYDLQYQSNVINVYLQTINKMIEHFQLCIIKYERCMRNVISFTLVDWCSLTKTAKSLNSEDKKKMKGIPSQSNIAIDLRQTLKEFKKDYEIDDGTIDNVLVYGKIPSFDKKEIEKNTEKIADLNDENKFWDCIKQIYEFIPNNLPPSFTPCLQYKSKLKNSDYWLSIRDYYYFSDIRDWYIFKFSGKLYNYKIAVENFNQGKIIHNIDELNKMKNIVVGKNGNNLLNKYLKNILNFEVSEPSPNSQEKLPNHYINYRNICYFNPFCVNELLQRLKSKKVYFDFESINLATRVVDNTPPFLQTVNQVSVVIDHGDGKLITKPFLVIDPLYGSNRQKFGINDLKTIVDTILPFPNDLEQCKQYSYVVYNKSFEENRLKEMAYYINDPEYSRKIDVITNKDNLYDLADLFTIKSDSDQCFIFPELHGFYSIKKVLPLVQKYDIATFKATGCKNYKTELELIHNGSEAQLYSSKRFFNLVSDEEWKNIVQHLGVYCNNDVLAMVAIEWFTKKILKGEINFKSSSLDR